MIPLNNLSMLVFVRLTAGTTLLLGHIILSYCYWVRLFLQVTSAVNCKLATADREKYVGNTESTSGPKTLDP